MFLHEKYDKIVTLQEIINSIKEDISIISVNDFIIKIIFINSKNEYFQIENKKITKRKLNNKRYKYIKKFDNKQSIILDVYF